MEIWVVGVLRQLFIEVLTIKVSFKKKKVVSGKITLFCDGSIWTRKFYVKLFNMFMKIF